MSSFLSGFDIWVLQLFREGPLHGYNLVKACPDLSVSTIYHSLHKLQAQGYLSRQVRFSQIGPQRTVYTLSTKGKKMLQSGLQHHQATLREQAETLLSNFLAIQRQLAWLQQLTPSGDIQSRR